MLATLDHIKKYTSLGGIFSAVFIFTGGDTPNHAI